MKNLYKYLLSALALVVLFGSTETLEAKGDAPPQPIHTTIKVDVKESHPVQGDITIYWGDGDTKNELGSHFVVTQYTVVANEKKSEEIARISRFPDSTERYSYRVSNLRPGNYCYSVALIDAETKSTSKPSERVCGTIKDSEPRMEFAKKNDFIRLDSDGNGEIVAKVINNTDCEAVLNWEMSDLILKGSQPLSSGGVLYKVQAPREGLYKAKINLINKCEGNIVDVMNVTVCYGKCDSTGNTPSLYFDRETDFSLSGQEHRKFSYDVNAHTTEKAEIKYYLSDALNGAYNIPKGFTIDENSGLMRWDSPIIGNYNIPVIVVAKYSNNDVERIEGVFRLRIGPNHGNYSDLMVNFYDETDEVKDYHGTVTVWSADREVNSPTGFPFAMSVDIEGDNAHFRIPAGKYYLRANVRGYKVQFYKDAFNINDAEIIEVGESDSVMLSMMLNSIPQPNFYTVSGRVTDARTGEPVPSLVTFQSIQSVIGGRDSLGSNNGNHSIAQVRTDEKGNYSVKLADINSYYAHARAIPKSNTVRYEVQFYEGAATYFEADIIFLKEDKSGVDFKLEKVEVQNGTISGSVSSKENAEVESTVIALSVDGKGNKSVTRTENGNYKFGNLNYGKYILLSLPNENNYLPGYFVAGDVASLTWEDASTIDVGINQDAVQYDIIHAEIERGSARGIANFRGRLMKKWKGMSPGEGGGESESISGAVVTLTSAEGNVYDYSISNTYGDFEMESIAQGTYTLNIDKIGYEAYSDVIEINYSESLDFGSDIELTAKVTTSVAYDTFDDNGLTVSPMPVLDNSTVRFTGEAGTANIELISINGDVVFSESITTNAGENTYELKANELVSGQYVLVIRNGEMITAGKITVVK